MKSLRRYLVAGLLVWIPLGITILLISFAVRQMDKTIGLIPEKYQPGVLLQQVFMAGADSIRDVIAFPKTQSAHDPLTDAPGEVSAEQLKETGIRIRAPRTEQ